MKRGLRRQRGGEGERGEGREAAGEGRGGPAARPAPAGHETATPSPSACAASRTSLVRTSGPPRGTPPRAPHPACSSALRCLRRLSWALLRR